MLIRSLKFIVGSIKVNIAYGIWNFARWPFDNIKVDDCQLGAFVQMKMIGWGAVPKMMTLVAIELKLIDIERRRIIASRAGGSCVCCERFLRLLCTGDNFTNARHSWLASL